MDSIFNNNENKGIASVNRRQNIDVQVSSIGLSMNPESPCLQSNSGETWTKETVDAAVALTHMAGLNAARRSAISPETTRS